MTSTIDRSEGAREVRLDEFERSLLTTLVRFKAGDFSARMPTDLTGIQGKIADVFNDILVVSERRSEETARVCRVSARKASSRSACACRARWAAGPTRSTPSTD